MWCKMIIWIKGEINFTSDSITDILDRDILLKDLMSMILRDRDRERERKEWRHGEEIENEKKDGR